MEGDPRPSRLGARENAESHPWRGTFESDNDGNCGRQKRDLFVLFLDKFALPRFAAFVDGEYRDDEGGDGVEP